MTSTLQKVFEQVSKLPEQDQEFIARLILDELESERRWDEQFARSLDKLEKLAEEARAENAAGFTEPLDPEEL